MDSHAHSQTKPPPHFEPLWLERFAAIDRVAAASGLAVTRRAVDGNCLFSCFVELLTKEDMMKRIPTIASLRQELVQAALTAINSNDLNPKTSMIGFVLFTRLI
jgi:hypothetical protein